MPMPRSLDAEPEMDLKGMNTYSQYCRYDRYKYKLPSICDCHNGNAVTCYYLLAKEIINNNKCNCR